MASVAVAFIEPPSGRAARKARPAKCGIASRPPKNDPADFVNEIGPQLTYGGIAVFLTLATLLIVCGVGERRRLAQPDNVGVWRRVHEGGRYVFGNEVLLSSMALDLFAVFFGSATALIPVVAIDVLHAGPDGFGILRSALALGALTSSALIAWHMPQRHTGLLLLLVVGAFGFFIAAFGLSTWLLLSVAALFGAGFCDGVSMVIRQTIVRLLAPEQMRGRISAVRLAFVGSASELGAFESGIAASLIGATAAIWSGGLIAIGIAAATAYAAPGLRRFEVRSCQIRPDEAFEV